VTERGEEGVARIKEMTKGIGADSVLECVGTHESMQQAIQATRPGGFVSYVGVPHGVELDGGALFFSHVPLCDPDNWNDAYRDSGEKGWQSRGLDGTRQPGAVPEVEGEKMPHVIVKLWPGR
jgi:threonine dehydrogenase-like Zn-dependent dehydrogenase